MTHQKKETKKKISSANEKVAKDVMRIFSDSEEIRLNLQKPIFKAVIFLFALQIIIFNAIIIYLVYKVIGCGMCSIKSTPELFIALLDFLKYYIGAVVVEIIGLVAVIIKSTFSLHPSKLVSELLHGDK